MNCARSRVFVCLSIVPREHSPDCLSLALMHDNDAGDHLNTLHEDVEINK